MENNIDKQELIEETQQAAIRKLGRVKLSETQIWEFWRDMGEDYFLRESVADIAWHTEAIADHPQDEPLILIKKNH